MKGFTAKISDRSKVILQRASAIPHSPFPVICGKPLTVETATVFPAAGDDRALLAALAAAVASGGVALLLDPAMLSHPHCPVAGDAYSTQALYITLAAAFAADWFFDWRAGLGVLVAALLFYRFVLRRYVHARMQRFASARLLGSLDLWRAMWRFGGVTLRTGAAGCRAPEGDWRGFVLALPKAAA